MTKRPSLAESMKMFSEPGPTIQMQPKDVSASSQQQEKKYYAATREGLKRLLVPIEPKIHKQLKLFAIQNDRTLESITREAIQEYLEKHDK